MLSANFHLAIAVLSLMRFPGPSPLLLLLLLLLLLQELWFAVYYETEEREDLTIACITEEPSTVHPSEATWSCECNACWRPCLALILLSTSWTRLNVGVLTLVSATTSVPLPERALQESEMNLGMNQIGGCAYLFTTARVCTESNPRHRRLRER